MYQPTGQSGVRHNNDKARFTVKLRKIRLEEEVHRSGDKVQFKEAKDSFRKAVKEATLLL